MANAWMVRPLPITAWLESTTPVQQGQMANAGNDYAGVVFTFPANSGPSTNYAYVRFDMGADVAVDAVMLFGVDGVPASVVAELFYATAAQGPFTGAYGSQSLGAVWAGSTAPVLGKVRSMFELPAPVTARYFTVGFSFTGSGGGVTLSRIVLGKRFQPARNFSYGGQIGVRDLGALDFSPRGVLMRRRGARLRTAALTFSGLQKDEVEGAARGLLEMVGNTEMIGLASDPAPDADRQNRLYFGPLVGELALARRNGRFWETRINLVSIF